MDICCSSLTASTSTIQPQPSSSQTPTTTSTPTTENFDTSVLPAGWDNESTISSSTESSIILALAIVLAGSICIFMIGCVIWRRRKKRTRDVERKFGHRPDARVDSQDTSREKDARGKIRMWAKATARWKSNIHQSARRRRKGHVPLNRPPSPTLSLSSQLSVVAPPTPSRRDSIASEEPDSSSPQVAGNVSEPPVVLHDPPRSASPPTYGASLVPRFSCTPFPSSAIPNSSSTRSPAIPYSAQRSNRPSSMDDEPLPYILPSDGHVATDDKAYLAHIQELASTPPLIIDTPSASTMEPVSAPEWHEVEDNLEDLDIDLSEAPTPFHMFGLPPSFPQPPSKADVPLHFGYLDDRPLRYGEGDDTLVSPPVPASPGPSLGAFPSAPLIDDPGLEPSAPSLEGEDELFQDWDAASSYVPEVPASADLDSTPSRAIDSSTLSSLPSILDSAARDSVLPRYHP
ncbi:hypothetical protein OG21DRAFT_31300 [Imleria badia]|nr:hypothetical protein OG21DRAFT_31300 [Imleria badia]